MAQSKEPRTDSQQQAIRHRLKVRAQEKQEWRQYVARTHNDVWKRIEGRSECCIEPSIARIVLYKQACREWDEVLHTSSMQGLYVAAYRIRWQLHTEYVDYATGEFTECLKWRIIFGWLEQLMRTSYQAVALGLAKCFRVTQCRSIAKVIVAHTHKARYDDRYCEFLMALLRGVGDKGYVPHITINTNDPQPHLSYIDEQTKRSQAEILLRTMPQHVTQATYPSYLCWDCGVPLRGSHRAPESRLSKCGGCGTAAYCSETCQKKHWILHKEHCESLGRIFKPLKRLMVGAAKSLTYEEIIRKCVIDCRPSHYNLTVPASDSQGRV